jgi:cytochrome P450
MPLLSRDLARYVPPSGRAWRDPFPMYAALREHDPVHRVDSAGDADRGYWVLTRHRDVFEAVRDHQTFSSAKGLTTRYDELERIGLADNPPMVMTDPPSHTEFRRLVSRGFTPRQVKSVEPAVRAFVIQRLDGIAAAGGGDIVAELVKPLPSMVVAHYLGVPEQDRGRFDAWTDAIVAANTTGAYDDVGDAISELMAYFTELIDRRRREPGDDTVSHLVAAGEAGDDTGLLRILAFTFTMVTGGNDTSTGLLGGAVQLLSERPDQRRIATRDVEATIEEMLRLTSPVQALARTTTRDVTIDGTTIPAGCKVLMCYAAANRDREVYGPDADDLDVTRHPRQILTFSHGAHHCLGAAAARMMGRVTLEELSRLIPDFRVDLDRVEWAEGSYVRRPTTVPLEVV